MISKVCIALLVFCVAAAYAQENHCCTPNKWVADARGVAGIHGQVANASELFYEVVYYDYDNRQMRFDIFADVFGIERHIEVTVIEKMVKGRWEAFHINKNGECKRHDPRIQFMEQACIKGGALHRWEYTLGGSLQVEGFLHEPRRDEFTEAAVTKHTCIPIHGAFHARHRIERAGSSVIWHNFRHGIEDPSVFNLPLACGQL